ncbi:hypothetical protein RF11_14529 [Thelohanellus kitauei]|uniref:Uncharacterized protein n=1 Tax=Thelohanellus kitauei TaxID=669202 RepID=A0A0C2MG84_THEKT|nr:hypothetical protein RF11_14529 [Thelohanellus kitauei]
MCQSISFNILECPEVPSIELLIESFNRRIDTTLKLVNHGSNYSPIRPWVVTLNMPEVGTVGNLCDTFKCKSLDIRIPYLDSTFLIPSSPEAGLYILGRRKHRACMKIPHPMTHREIEMWVLGLMG